MTDGLVNKTIRAICVIGVLLFALGTIVWVMLYGQPANSLHASALSWSYTLIGFTLLALGIDRVAASVWPGQAPPATK